MVIRSSDLQDVGSLYWVTGGRMYRVSAIADRVDHANHFMEDNGGQVITQSEHCELILISDDETGHKVSFR